MNFNIVYYKFAPSTFIQLLPITYKFHNKYICYDSLSHTQIEVLKRCFNKLCGFHASSPLSSSTYRHLQQTPSSMADAHSHGSPLAHPTSPMSTPCSLPQSTPLLSPTSTTSKSPFQGPPSLILSTASSSAVVTLAPRTVETVWPTPSVDSGSFVPGRLAGPCSSMDVL